MTFTSKSIITRKLPLELFATDHKLLCEAYADAENWAASKKGTVVNMPAAIDILANTDSATAQKVISAAKEPRHQEIDFFNLATNSYLIKGKHKGHDILIALHKPEGIINSEFFQNPKYDPCSKLIRIDDDFVKTVFNLEGMVHISDLKRDPDINPAGVYVKAIQKKGMKIMDPYDYWLRDGDFTNKKEIFLKSDFVLMLAGNKRRQMDLAELIFKRGSYFGNKTMEIDVASNMHFNNTMGVITLYRGGIDLESPLAKATFLAVSGNYLKHL
ncbi:MAG: hypothetical protein ACP5N3_00830 [Candidatus Nanoarchaeia archaeon]